VHYTPANHGSWLHDSEGSVVKKAYVILVKANNIEFEKFEHNDPNYRAYVIGSALVKHFDELYKQQTNNTSNESENPPKKRKINVNSIKYISSQLSPIKRYFNIIDMKKVVHGYSKYNSIPKFRQYSCVRTIPDQTLNIERRFLSCFCQGCMTGVTCLKKEFVGDWTPTTIKLKSNAQQSVNT